jgi:hypothetical protein
MYDQIDEYGYVFVLLSDITQLNCDYWLGTNGKLNPKSQRNFPPKAYSVEIVPSDNRTWKEAGYMGKLVSYEPWPAKIPKPYCVTLTYGRGETRNYIDEIERFIRAAAADAKNRSPDCKARKGVCPLIAIPLLGTGGGGNYNGTGEMIKLLLPVLYRLGDELHVDIAIATIEKDIYKLIQSVRQSYFLENLNTNERLQSTISGNRYLRRELINKVPVLGQHAIKGELTVFAGAGCSMGAGLPSWEELLAAVAERLGLDDSLMLEFNKLDYYTKAAILESRLKKANRSRKIAECKVSRSDSTSSIISTSDNIDSISHLNSEKDCIVETEKDDDGSTLSTVSTEKHVNYCVFFQQTNGCRDGDKCQYQHILPESRSPEKKAHTSSSISSPRTLGHYIAELTTSSCHSVVHSLLASLPVNEVNNCISYFPVVFMCYSYIICS